MFRYCKKNKLNADFTIALDSCTVINRAILKGKDQMIIIVGFAFHTAFAATTGHSTKSAIDNR